MLSSALFKIKISHFDFNIDSDFEHDKSHNYQLNTHDRIGIEIVRSWNTAEDRTIRSSIRTSSIDDDLSLDDLKWDEDDDLDETFVAFHNQTIKPNGNHPSVENLPFSGDT